jgi:hypothetical protein
MQHFMAIFHGFAGFLRKHYMAHVIWSRTQLEGCSVEKLRSRALDLRDALELSKPIPHTATSLIAWILENQVLHAKMQSFDVSEDDLRTLAAAGDDAARQTVVRELFEKIYGSPPAKMSLAGGRVNLIGEHVDYPDVQFAGRPAGTPVVHLFSMGGAIQNNYLVAASQRSDSKISIAHAQVGKRYTVNIADLPALEAAAVAERKSHLDMQSRSSPEWTFHTLGAVMEMAQRGVALSGMDLLLTSNVPHGAGMSNSAANCVALGLVFNALFPALNINSTIELTTFARCAENSKFAGGQCGWLDQLLITNSKANHVTKIDYADNSIQVCVRVRVRVRVCMCVCVSMFLLLFPALRVQASEPHAVCRVQHQRAARPR